MPLEQRKKMIDGEDKGMSILRQCQLLGMHRSAYYYKSKGISEADLRIMERMDRMYSEDPTRGTRRYRRDLKLAGIHISRDKVRGLMKIMRIKTIYCKPRMTVIDPAAYKYPYLLRGVGIVRVKQVWQIDIGCIPMEAGLVYLVAIIDVYSRFIVGWYISNSMQAGWVVETLKGAIARYGSPRIINSDQGTQFTSNEYIGYIKGLKTVRISMDGKGRATDNAHIERFFRTIKHDKIYLHLPEDGGQLFTVCNEFIEFSNTRRGHCSIDGLPPAQRYVRQAA